MKVVPVWRTAMCTLLLIFAAGCTPDNSKATPVSVNYSVAQKALAEDNFGEAKTALAALAAETTGDFQKEIQIAASATDIDSMRVAFRSASDVLIKNGVPPEYAVRSRGSLR